MAGLDFLFIYVETGLSPLVYSAFLPPLGVIQIATFLRQKGFKVRVVDARHMEFSVEWFASYVHDFTPRYVGFTLQTDTLLNAGRLIDIVRKESPSSRIICGGPHPTICYESVLSDMDVDAVVRGRGELPCLGLVEGKAFSDVQGLAYKRRRRVLRNGEESLLSLDDIPSPDCSIVEGSDRIPYSPSIISGYGCPYRCTFCAACVLSPRVTFKTVDKVIEDLIVAQRKYPGRLLMILDDTFTIDPSRIDEFCRKAKAAGGGRDFLWYAEGRVDVIAKYQDILDKMYDAGMRILQFGLESADERVLKAYNKQIKLNDVERLCSRCADIGIFMHTNFIFGGPYESEETISKTRSYARRLIEISRGFMQMGFLYLTPLPGTEIFNHPEKYGLRILDPELYSSASFDNCVTETESLSRDEILSHRAGITVEMFNYIIETVKAQGPDFKQRCDSLLKKVGPVHFCLYLHKFDSVTAFYADIWKGVLRNVDKFSQFLHRAGDDILNRVPVRVSFMTPEVGGLVLSPAGEAVLTELETRVINLCAGKLTAKGIANELSASEEDVIRALRVLEDKRTILYRSF